MPKLSNKGVQLPFSPTRKLETYVENFCRFLLEDFNDSKQKIMLAPAQGFCSTPGYGIDKVRFAFILKPSKLIRATQILEKALKIYQN